MGNNPQTYDRVTIGDLLAPVVIPPGTTDVVARYFEHADALFRHTLLGCIVVPFTGIDIESIRDWNAAPTSPPDPRIARDKARAEIDAVLREDASRFPAFATARRCAVMSECEPMAHVGSENTGGRDAGRMLAMLHRYEERRGGLTVPRAGAAAYAEGDPMFGHYERARGMR